MALGVGVRACTWGEFFVRWGVARRWVRVFVPVPFVGEACWGCAGGARWVVVG